MTQANPIIGSGKSGIEYRGDDNDGKQALLNHHKGSSAPSYAEAGIVWLDDAATPWLLKVYDGTDWIVLSAINASTNAVTPYLGTGALKILNFATDTGSANACAVAPVPAIAAYAAGQAVFLKPANANTGAATLAVSGLSATAIKMPDGTDPAAGMLLTTGVYLLVYNGTNFTLLNPSLSSSPSIVWAVDQQSSGATPSSATTAAWTKRALNTLNKNTVTGATHSSGTISLPAGTYSVCASLVLENTHASAFPTVTCRLRDTTNNVTLAPGMPQSPYLSGAACLVVCDGVFTLTGTANVELQYYCTNTGTPKLGRDAGSGDVQLWAGVYLKKEA